MNIPSSSIPLVAPETHSRLQRIWERIKFWDSNSFPSSTTSLAPIGGNGSRYVSEVLDRYKRQAADLGVPPELIVVDKIFTLQKNLREFCRAWHDDRPLHYDSVDGTIALLRLQITVLEELVEERKGG